jgi:dynein assembly factor 2
LLIENYIQYPFLPRTALEGIEAAFNLKLDRKRLRFPKLKFKGSIHTTVMRRPMTDQELEEYQESKTKTEDHQEPNLETVKDVVKKEPKYAIKYRHSTQDVPLLADHGVTDPCRPSEMIVEVSLPEMTSAKGIDLDVLEHLMTLESEVPVAYKLVLKLPYPVFEDQGAAKFDKSQHSLVVTLPVKAANKEPVSRLISTDSGIGLDFDNTEAEAVVIDDTAYRTNSDQVLEDQVRRNLPPYNCNIYEGLMVLTIPVQNVVVDSLDRQLLEGNKGYQLSFQTLGQGFVPMEYGFCLAFDFESEVGSCSLEDLEIEVWDNNMILQLCIPKSGCSNFCVGTYKGDLGDAMPLPRLEAVKDKCFMLNKDKRERLDSDDSVESSGHDEDEEAFKERHRSGDSEDSAISVSPPSSICSDSPSKRFLVTPAQVLSEDNSSNSKGLDQVLDSMSSIRGILKRQRCYSESQADILRMMSSMDTCTIYEEDEEDLDDEETSRTRTDSSGSKKSVRFNEIVQRQIYRSNSSILGQKNKNQKKADQKKRKTERRVSEGDVSSNHFDDPDDAEDYYDDEHTNDSGMASSMEEAGLVQTRHKIKTKTSGNRGCLKRSIGLKAGTSTGSSRFMDESSSDLIFDLDF